MSNYVKRPIEVEAVRWNGENLNELKTFCGEKVYFIHGFNDYFPQIKTLEGNMSVSKGDYIIKGVEGEFYPCKPGIFHKTYIECMDNKERAMHLNNLYITEYGMDDNETFYIHLLAREHEKNTLQRIGALPEVIEANVKVDKESQASYIDLVPIANSIEGIELYFDFENEEITLRENKFFVSFTFTTGNTSERRIGNGVIFHRKKLSEMDFEDISYIQGWIADENSVSVESVILTNIIEMGEK